MNVETSGGKSFSHLKVTLQTGETVLAEAGAMASMDGSIELVSRARGGVFAALFRWLFAAESFFINYFTNKASGPKQIVLTNPVPGEIVCKKLEANERYFIQPGAVIMMEKSVKFRPVWAGFVSWIVGEGLFRIQASGPGTIWYGAFGAVVERQVDGELIVDSGHLLSYPTSVKLKLQLAGGIFSSFFGGEGFVARLEGKGKILLQTRSLGGLAGWLNPKFWS